MSLKPTAKSRRVPHHDLRAGVVEGLKIGHFLSPQLVSKAQPPGIPSTPTGRVSRLPCERRWSVHGLCDDRYECEDGNHGPNAGRTFILYDKVNQTTTLVSHQNGSLTTAGNGRPGSPPSVEMVVMSLSPAIRPT